jgi:hypothetical protein
MLNFLQSVFSQLNCSQLALRASALQFVELLWTARFLDQGKVTNSTEHLKHKGKSKF